MKTRSLDLFTRVDANLVPRARLTTALAVYPRRVDRSTMDTFTPPEATSAFRQRGFNLGVSLAVTIGDGALVESTANIKRYDVSILPERNDEMTLTPEGRSGAFFNHQDRETDSVQLIQTVTRAHDGLAGQHLFKAGFDLLHGRSTGTSGSRPVNVVDASGRLLQRITFDGPARWTARATHVAAYLQDRWRVNDRLSVEGGARLDRDGVLETWSLSPRAGLAVALDDEARTVVRGGGGLFVQQTPLNVAAFGSFERRTLTSYAGDGLAGLSMTFDQSTSASSTAHGLTWNLEATHRLTPAWQLKAAHLVRRGRDELIVRQATSPEPLVHLSSDGRSFYRELELGVRLTPSARHEILATYVLSRSESDANAFDRFFGNMREPVIRENAYGRASIDVPHRVLIRGVVGLPAALELYPVIEIRNGLPYSAIDARQALVGLPNDGGRLPVLATVDLTLMRPVKFGKWTPYLGIRVLNALNRFTPRDVQNNMASPAFGRFYHSIPRSIAFTGTIPR
jgi:hypothetical protein